MSMLYSFFFEKLLKIEKNKEMCSFGGRGHRETLLPHFWCVLRVEGPFTRWTVLVCRGGTSHWLSFGVGAGLGELSIFSFPSFLSFGCSFLPSVLWGQALCVLAEARWENSRQRYRAPEVQGPCRWAPEQGFSLALTVITLTVWSPSIKCLGRKKRSVVISLSHPNMCF